MPFPATLAAAVVPLLAPAPQGLDLTAVVVPGSTEARIAGAPPAGLLALLLGSRCTLPLPGGRCLGIEPQVVAGICLADASGQGFVAARFPVGTGAGLAFVAQALALDQQQALGSPAAFSLSAPQRLVVPEHGASADVYVLFGQSNAEGQAETRSLPQSLNGPLPQGRVWNELASLWQPLTAGVNNTTLLRPDRCGPELTLARDLAAGGRAVYLLKFAVGQTSLGPAPGPWNEWGVEAGELYGELLRRLDRSCAALRRDGLVPRVRGVAMMQGESDALDPELAASYRALLALLVQQLRSDLAARELTGPAAVPFVLGLVDQELAGTGFLHVPVVRRAQQSVVDDLPCCAAVDTTGLALQPDRVHFATTGVMAFGSALAAELLRLEGSR